MEVVEVTSFQLAGFYWLHQTFKLSDQRSLIQHRELGAALGQLQM